MLPLFHELEKSLPSRIVFSLAKRPYRTASIVLLLVLASIFWVYHAITAESFITLLNTGLSTQVFGPGGGRHNGSAAGLHKPVGIPMKIWQIMLPKPRDDGPPHPPDPAQLQDTPSWLVLNPDYKYTLVGERGGIEFVDNNFADQPAIIETYKGLQNMGMKSDLLRYLLLYIEGGVYTDTDTVAIKGVDEWVPDLIKSEVNLVVGIEFDRRDGAAWTEIPHWLQFCQWTIAAKPKHPVFQMMVQRALYSIDLLSTEVYNSPLDSISPTSFEVMNSTGPAAWTDVVFEYLQQLDPSLEDTKDLSFMTGPKLIGDVLVLNIDGFGMGQQHSKSTNDGTIPSQALVKHLFRGSWRTS
ncbi:hypothetical protein V2G26_005443 [Clonostachys chloroleuca]